MSATNKTQTGGGGREGEGAQGVRLRVVPNARKTEVCGVHGEAVKVKVAGPAVEGKANAALLEFVAGLAGVGARRAVLVSGEKSRDKVVRVEGVAAQELRRMLLDGTLRGGEVS